MFNIIYTKSKQTEIEGKILPSTNLLSCKAIDIVDKDNKLNTNIDLVIGINDSIKEDCFLLDDQRKDKCTALSKAGYNTPFLRVFASKLNQKNRIGIQTTTVGEYTVNKSEILLNISKYIITYISSITSEETEKIFNKINLEINDKFLEIYKMTKTSSNKPKFIGEFKKEIVMTDDDIQNSAGLYNLLTYISKGFPQDEKQNITIKQTSELSKQNKRKIIKKLKEIWSSILYGFTPELDITFI